MSFLGSRRSPAAVVSNGGLNPFGDGFWAVTFDPAILSAGANIFEVYHIFLQGPSGSTFQVFIDTQPYSTATRGDYNEYDPNSAITLYGGQSLIFYWNSHGTPLPLVYLSLRTPKD